jgi:large subunit ribosomal protein L22
MSLNEMKSSKGREKFYRMNQFEEAPSGHRRVPRKKLRKMYHLALHKAVVLQDKNPELVEKLDKIAPGLVQKAMDQTAEARFLRTSTRKMNAVMALVRGKKVTEAQAILRFTNKKAARLFEKVLNSAIANVANNTNTEWDVEDLYIHRAIAEQGPTLARIRPMSMGRVGRIRKRTCHARVVLKAIPRKEASV